MPLTVLGKACFFVILLIMVTKHHGLVLGSKIKNSTNPISLTRSSAFGLVSVPFCVIDELRPPFRVTTLISPLSCY